MIEGTIGPSNKPSINRAAISPLYDDNSPISRLIRVFLWLYWYILA